MKKFKIFFFLVCFAIFIGWRCTEINNGVYSGQNSLFANSTENIVLIDSTALRIAKITDISSDIKKLNRLQNGVCDTCITGYISVIIENRRVSNELSKQTEILENKVLLIEHEIDKADSLLRDNYVQLSKLKVINKKTRQEWDKQKNEYYALTKNN